MKGLTLEICICLRCLWLLLKENIVLCRRQKRKWGDQVLYRLLEEVERSGGTKGMFWKWNRQYLERQWLFRGGGVWKAECWEGQQSSRHIPFVEIGLPDCLQHHIHVSISSSMKEDTTIYLFRWLCWSKGITHGEHHAQKMAFLWLSPFCPITSTLLSIILLFFRWARFSLLFAHPLTSTQISSRDSLAVQWLGLRTSTAGGTGSIPGWGTKIPLGTTRKIPLSIPFVQYWGYPFSIHCCCSVTKSCPTLCNPMNCSTPGFSVLHYLPEFAQIYVNP